MNRVESSPRPEFDQWQEVLEQLPLALDLARHMRKYANHYDGRHYGAVILGFTPDNALETFTGANTNMMPGQNPTKQCAERDALKKAKAEGVLYVPAVVVSGHIQPDTQSGKRFETTHPCGNCRHDIAVSGMADDSTLIVSYHPEEPVVEVNTLRETIDIHSGALPVEASNVFRDEELTAMCMAPERYTVMRRMYDPSPYLARLALATRSVEVAPSI